jgi:hypothetical protein
MKKNYSMWIASAGQTSTQVWQSTHISLSTLAFSFSMAIADAGHSLTQVSHPVHFLRSTTATNSVTPSYMFYKRQKIGFAIAPGVIRQKRGLFFEAEHIGHVVDAGFFAHNPPGCMQGSAGQDYTIGRMMG